MANSSMRLLLNQSFSGPVHLHRRDMQAYSNRTVDFVLALLLLIGSTFGAQIGERLSARLKDDPLKIFLAVLVLAVMVKMLFSLALPPYNLLSYHGGH